MAVIGVWDEERGTYVSPAEKWGYRWPHTYENRIAATSEELDQWMEDELWPEIDADRFLSECVEFDHLEGGWYLDPDAEPWDFVSD